MVKLSFSVCMLILKMTMVIFSDEFSLRDKFSLNCIHSQKEYNFEFLYRDRDFDVFDVE